MCLATCSLLLCYFDLFLDCLMFRTFAYGYMSNSSKHVKQRKQRKQGKQRNQAKLRNPSKPSKPGKPRTPSKAS